MIHPLMRTRRTRYSTHIDTEVRNQIYAYICDGINVKTHTTLTNPYQPVVGARDRTDPRPFAIAAASQSIRAEFLTLLLLGDAGRAQIENDTHSERSTLDRLASRYGVSVRVYAKVHVFPPTTPRPLSENRRGAHVSTSIIRGDYCNAHELRLIFRISCAHCIRCTRDSISSIEATLARIFRSERHVTFEHLVVAVDQLSGVSLVAEEVPSRSTWEWLGDGEIYCQVSRSGVRSNPEIRVSVTGD